tara:strand:+ start:436 stop:600 length:165 start_codon:yes stop_codon:yes gene_type:complete
MTIDDKNYCDECKKCVDEDDHYDCIWIAKDGREYCNYCYRFVFYPKWYGFPGEK